MGSNPNFDVMLGAPVVELLNREDITEIYVNDDGFIRYESYREGKIKTKIYLDVNVNEKVSQSLTKF